MVPALSLGGVETGTVDLAKALKTRGHHPYVISSGGTLVAELVKAGIGHLQLPVHRKSLASLALIKPIADFLERERIDILHARSRVPAWLGYLATRRTNCDFVTTCHGYYAKHFLSRVMGWGKRVIVISHSIGRRMIDDFGVRPERITLIHRGIDLSGYPFSPDKYDRPPSGKLTVIHVGRISPIKGHHDFLKAVHLLSRRLPNLQAWIVGAPDEGKGSYFRNLTSMAESLGLGSGVQFLGMRRDVPELIRRADLLVLPSRIPEAFGRVLIEAGAVGTAVCASRIGGILDVIDEGENGLLFAPENFEDMALVMERLLLDRPKCKALAHALRKKVEQEFNLDQMVNRTCRVYEEVRREKKILITKLGALGDLVLAVPSFRMVRHRFPEARMSLLVEAKLLPVIQRCPYLDDFICVNRSRGRRMAVELARVAKQIQRAGFDLSIDLQNNWRSYLVAFLGRIPRRYGYRRGLLGSLLTHPVLEWNRDLAPVEHQFQVLKRAGVLRYDDTMELWSEPDQDRASAEILRNPSFASPPRPVVGLVLNSSPRWPTKQWPVERFSELARRLVKELDCTIVLLGTGGGQPLAQTFDGVAREYVVNLVGKTTLTQLTSSIKHLDALVTGDSAPLHIASAFGTKIVALFGPTEPRRHMPPGASHIALVKRIPCQPCYRGRCVNHETLKCLRDISVEEVFRAVARQLA